MLKSRDCWPDGVYVSVPSCVLREAISNVVLRAHRSMAAFAVWWVDVCVCAVILIRATTRQTSAS